MTSRTKKCLLFPLIGLVIASIFAGAWIYLPETYFWYGFVPAMMFLVIIADVFTAWDGNNKKK